MAGLPGPVAYSFEMVLVGAMLLSAMAAGGVAVLRRSRARHDEPPTDKSAEAEPES